jgi:hypothetical protein
MKLFICTDHDDHWPVGVASVVVAATEGEARALLDQELVSRGLRPHDRKAYTLREVDLSSQRAIVMCDGSY